MRAVVVFIATLIFIRISGRRSFGQRSPFDYVLAVLLGATLSRVIVGASPATPTMVASLAMVLVHRALAWSCVRWSWLESLVVGVEREVYRDGQFNSRLMPAALITRTDIFETARQKLNSANLQRCAVGHSRMQWTSESDSQTCARPPRMTRLRSLMPAFIRRSARRFECRRTVNDGCACIEIHG
jgi:hypothetical protein